MEVSQPAAAGCSAQHAEEAIEGERSELEDGGVIISEEDQETGAIDPELATLRKLNSHIRNLEARHYMLT